jgi:hypothetical protein
VSGTELAQIILAILGIVQVALTAWLAQNQRALHHEMNSMKDALVVAAHAQGRLEEKDAETKRAQGVDERLREMRGNGP